MFVGEGGEGLSVEIAPIKFVDGVKIRFHRQRRFKFGE